MSDLVARAEAVLEGVTEGVWDVRDGFVYPLSIRCTLGGIREQDAQFIAAARSLVPELIAELKAARASEERHLHEIFHLQDDLKAARAEAERLTVVIDRIDGLHVESSMWPGKCCGCEYGSSSPCVTASVIERLRGETR